MTSYVDVIRPSKKRFAYTYDLFCIIAGSLFLGLLAQVTVPLWFTPVPISLQSFGVLLMGALLGSKRGPLAITAYILEGACGLPVFAGGSFGIAKIIGPTGGYILGFVLASFLIGFLLEKGWKKSYTMTLLALFLGSCLILAIGAFWLSFYVGSKNAFPMGVYPFLIGDVVKILAAALLIPTGWKILR